MDEYSWSNDHFSKKKSKNRHQYFFVYELVSKSVFNADLEKSGLSPYMKLQFIFLLLETLGTGYWTLDVGHTNL